MNQDNVLPTNSVESDDKTSDVDIESCDVEEIELKNKISGEMSNKAIVIDSTDCELDIEVECDHWIRGWAMRCWSHRGEGIRCQTRVHLWLHG